MSGSDKNLVLIGAGLTGPLLATYLAHRGYTIDIYERRPDMRSSSIPAGRSINLALSERGIHALKEIGIFDKIRKLIIPMKGRMIHEMDGSTSLQPYGKDENEVINSISRAELNMALMSQAEETGNVTIHFNQKCTGMDCDHNVLYLENQESGETKSLTFKHVIGTDGSASAIRASMKKLVGYAIRNESLGHGYKELIIPASDSGDFVLAPNALHIWPRKAFMLIALPNLDKSFTCTLFMPMEGSHGFSELIQGEEISNFFKNHFQDAVSIMPSLLEDWKANLVGKLGTVHSFPWNVEGKVLLIGDAAHAIVPFFGQGMNAAFEDCSILNSMMNKFESDWAGLFSEFSRMRKPDTDAIADMALENYIEMRDKVADPKYIRHREIEKILEAEFPESFIPRYSMVSFHRIPYSEVQKKGAIQTEIIRKLGNSAGGSDELDLALAEKIIIERL